MNGYRARVQRHREELAEQTEQGERTAIPGYIWRAAILGGRRVKPVEPAPPAEKPHRDHEE